MKRRWYRRCGADFIHGTMSLSLEEKGAYSLCLDLIYDRGGPIPDDARWLAGICNVSTRRWASLRQRLIDLGKLTLNDGLLSNVRAEFEIISAETQARKLSESGAKGGRTRAENDAERKENNDLGEASLKHIREEKRREEEGSVAKATVASATIDPEKEFWDRAKGYLQPYAKGDPGALIGRWLKDQGKERTMAALNAAQLERAVNPLEYVPGYFRRQGERIRAQPAVPL